MEANDAVVCAHRVGFVDMGWAPRTGELGSGPGDDFLLVTTKSVWEKSQKVSTSIPKSRNKGGKKTFGFQSLEFFASPLSGFLFPMCIFGIRPDLRRCWVLPIRDKSLFYVPPWRMNFDPPLGHQRHTKTSERSHQTPKLKAKRLIRLIRLIRHQKSDIKDHEHQRGNVDSSSIKFKRHRAVGGSDADLSSTSHCGGERGLHSGARGEVTNKPKS